jgi:6-phosphogluconolactonase
MANMAIHRMLPTVLAGMLTVFLMAGAVSGCSGNHSLPPNNCGTDGALFTLTGTVTGLAGFGLEVHTSPNPSGPIVNMDVFGNGSQQLGAVNCNTPYELTVASQPLDPPQTCVIANGSGPGGETAFPPSGVSNIVITCTTNPPRFAYVVNQGSNNISAYTLDAATGVLTPVAGSPFAAGHVPAAVAVDPAGRYVYVANQSDATISAFEIDRATGALTPVAGSPFATPAAPTSVAIDPSGTLVYVTNSGAGTVSVYTISASSGALTVVTGSPFAIGGSPSSVIVAPGNNYTVFVADHSQGTVSNYAPPFLGVLAIAPGWPLAIGPGPLSMAIDPPVAGAGGALYVASGTANTLTGLAEIQTAQAAATPGSPYPTGTGPASVALTPLNNSLYVANAGSSDISAYSVDALTGALTTLTGSPFSAGLQPSSLAIDPTGTFVYETDTGSNGVSVYAINPATGALTPISGSPFAAGARPAAIAISD